VYFYLRGCRHRSRDAHTHTRTHTYTPASTPTTGLSEWCCQKGSAADHSSWLGVCVCVCVCMWVGGEGGEGGERPGGGGGKEGGGCFSYPCRSVRVCVRVCVCNSTPALRRPCWEGPLWSHNAIECACDGMGGPSGKNG
jgi:hypothetical protein